MYKVILKTLLVFLLISALPLILTIITWCLTLGGFPLIATIHHGFFIFMTIVAMFIAFVVIVTSFNDN